MTHQSRIDVFCVDEFGVDFMHSIVSHHLLLKVRVSKVEQRRSTKNSIGCAVIQSRCLILEQLGRVHILERIFRQYFVNYEINIDTEGMFKSISRLILSIWLMKSNFSVLPLSLAVNDCFLAKIPPPHTYEID